MRSRFAIVWRRKTAKQGIGRCYAVENQHVVAQRVGVTFLSVRHARVTDAEYFYSRVEKMAHGAWE
jgi:hypothetical protein